jgi:hypothetical protein
VTDAVAEILARDQLARPVEPLARVARALGERRRLRRQHGAGGGPCTAGAREPLDAFDPAALREAEVLRRLGHAEAVHQAQGEDDRAGQP